MAKKKGLAAIVVAPPQLRKMMVVVVVVRTQVAFFWLKSPGVETRILRFWVLGKGWNGG